MMIYHVCTEPCTRCMSVYDTSCMPVQFQTLRLYSMRTITDIKDEYIVEINCTGVVCKNGGYIFVNV